jgi:RHS repeat-associated protein
VRKKVSGACGPLAARYAYDVLGRRIVKRVYGTYGGLGPVYLRMIYRGGQVVAETDSVGTSLSLAYTWGFGADDLVAIHRYSDSGHWYVVQDNLRSVRGLTTRSGTWAASWRYRIYGAVLDSAGTPPSFTLRYRWIGREYDAETGLYYVRARYYDLASQRFTQEDPIGYAGGSNLYAYGSGNPTTGRDLSGLAMYVGLYEPVWSDHLPVECPIFADCWSGSGGSRRTWMDDVNDHWALIHLQMELQETDYDAYLKKAKGNLEIIGGDPSEVMSRAEFDRAKRAIQNVVNDGRVQDVSVAGVLGFLAGGAVLVAITLALGGLHVARAAASQALALYGRWA